MINAEAHLPMDTSVIMPPAVRAAAMQADALMAASIAPPSGGPPPAAHDFQPPQAPVAQQQPLPVPTAGPPPPAGWSQPPMAPQVPAQVTPQAPAPLLPNGEPAPAQPGTTEALWERRARSYHGQMTADRATAQREIAGLRQQLEAVMAQITNGSPAPRNGQASTIALDPAKRAKLVEKWGDEMVADMEEVAGGLANAAMGQVTQRVGTEIQGTRDELHERDRIAMETSLDQMLPDWRIANDDEGFKNWLQTQDGFSRLSRHQVLLAAYNGNDTQAVYRIFAAYMLPQSGSGPDMTPPVNPQPSNRLPMHQFAAPGSPRPAGHGAPASPEVNQYTPSHIAWFFAQKARGVFNDTPQRQQWAAAIEADIFAAQREGRVVADQRQ